MITGFQAMAYMKAKGSAQGTFAEDKSRAGKDRTLCLSVGFRGEVPHDVRGGKQSTTHHKPVSIVHLWSPATVQFMTALWANETLDEVELELLREQARRALAHLGPGAPQRPWLEALGAVRANWELPIALDPNDVLVIPRLSALARLQDFHSEVGLAGTSL